MTSTAKRRLAVAPAPKRWNHRAWGTLADPCHKSSMSALVGEYSCGRQWQFDKHAELNHVPRETVAGKTAMGTAVHESIARALRNPATREPLLIGRVPMSPESIGRVVRDEFDREVGTRTVSWYGKSDFDDELQAAVSMLLGLFADLHRHVRAVELVEAGFIAQLGPLFIEGHTDLVYRPYEGDADALAFTDWKTGAQKPHPLQLEHGFEGGFYAQALRAGLFVPAELLDVWRLIARTAMQLDVPLDLSAGPSLPFDAVTITALAVAPTERAAMHVALRACMQLRLDGRALPEGVRTFDRFPDVIRLTHLRDYVPYEKKGTKAIERDEDLAHWSRVLGRDVIKGEKIGYEKGQQRGGAWLPVGRREGDVARLEHMLRAIVGWVRFGRFVEAVGEKCTRCTHRVACLTDGYGLNKDEMRGVNAALAGLDLGGADDLGLD